MVKTLSKRAVKITADLIKKRDMPEKAKMIGYFTNLIKAIDKNQSEETEKIYTILEKEMEFTNTSEEFKNLSNMIIKQYENFLNEDLSFEEKMKILESEKEIYDILREMEEERLERNKQIAEEALRKDSEKTELRWNIIKFTSFTVLAVIAGIGGYHGPILKLPRK